MKKMLLAALLLGVSFTVQAQNVTGQVTVNWTNPTTAIDGSPLTGSQALTKNQIFVETATIPNGFAGAPKVEVGPSISTGAVTMTVPSGATLYVRVKSCNSGGCSDFSSEATKVVTVPRPGVPTTVTIQLTITP
jgi:hypothetical protein